MSFNRLNYDSCQYKQNITESTGPGSYQLTTPPIACEPCYPEDPQLRLQHSGDGVDPKRALIDVDSELLNITRPRSKCPSRKWIPECDNYDAKGYPCGQGVVGTCRKCPDATAPSNLRREDKCPDQFAQTVRNWRDCGNRVEDTRLMNPPCNLRGTGFNRWEWLCLNPQDRTEMPFDTNICNRIIVKDNHRPCIPKLKSPYRFPDTPLPCEKTQSTCGAFTHMCE